MQATKAPSALDRAELDVAVKYSVFAGYMLSSVRLGGLALATETPIVSTGLFLGCIGFSWKHGSQWGICCSVEKLHQSHPDTLYWIAPVLPDFAFAVKGDRSCSWFLGCLGRRVACYYWKGRVSAVLPEAPLR